MEELLNTFRTDFESTTGIKTNACEKVYGWYKLYLSSLDCEKMEIMARYIRLRFTCDGLYTHLLPTLSTFNGKLCLSISVELAEKKLKQIKS